MGVAHCLKGLGDVHLRRRGYDNALKAYGEAKGIYQELGSRDREATCREALATILLEQSNFVSAREEIIQARALYEGRSQTDVQRCDDVLGKINDAFGRKVTTQGATEKRNPAPFASKGFRRGFLLTNRKPTSKEASHRLKSKPVELTSTLGTPSPISRLPNELLCHIFSFLQLSDLLGDDPAVVLTGVCQLWRHLSVPYLHQRDMSTADKHNLLELYPGAGRLLNHLAISTKIRVVLLKEIIAGSPNVTHVEMDAFWNGDEAKIVLGAIGSLRRLEFVTFGERGSRKWKNEELENFMQGMGGRVRYLNVWAAEESPSAPFASAGLQLSRV
ncbi:hypothetical protein BT69DRAFT_858495 [Atractiella rhizophila]|nr:hypothetical protein BT69DRAFT_858495 [Atractiella rhizophila]